MNLRQQLERLPLFTVMTGISLAIGLIVPSVFEWTEEPAARSRHPEMEWAALLAIVIPLVIAAMIWFLRKPSAAMDDSNLVTADSTRRLQFGIRHILIATTLMAVLIALAVLMKWTGTSAAVCGLAIGMLGWSLFQNSAVRSRIGALLVSTFLPFAWIIPTNVPFGHTSGLVAALPFAPGILPATLLKSGHINETQWIAALFVFVELVIGLFFAHRGGKLAVSYVVLILILSSVSSFGMHAMYRM